jgi:hypothetical protein
MPSSVQCYSFIDGNPASPSGYYPTTPVSYGTHTVNFFYLPTTTLTLSNGYTSVITGTGSSNGFVAVTSGAAVWGRDLIIQWESTDQVVLAWMSAQTMSSSTSAAGPTNSTTAAIPTGGHHSISAGAIAGIAIGAVAGLTFLILGVWLLLRRRKRSERGNPQATNQQVNPPALAPKKGTFVSTIPFGDVMTNGH